MFPPVWLEFLLRAAREFLCAEKAFGHVITTTWTGSSKDILRRGKEFVFDGSVQLQAVIQKLGSPQVLEHGELAVHFHLFGEKQMLKGRILNPVHLHFVEPSLHFPRINGARAIEENRGPLETGSAESIPGTFRIDRRDLQEQIKRMAHTRQSAVNFPDGFHHGMSAKRVIMGRPVG